MDIGDSPPVWVMIEGLGRDWWGGGSVPYPVVAMDKAY